MPSLPVRTSEDILAAGKQATSQEEKLPSPSPPNTSHNYFDELAFDSDDDADFCFELTDNNLKTSQLLTFPWQLPTVLTYYRLVLLLLL